MLETGIDNVVRWHNRTTNDLGTNLTWTNLLDDGSLNIGMVKGSVADATLTQVGTHIKVSSTHGYTYIHQSEIVAFLKGMAWNWTLTHVR
jgi:hypothetical protein